MRFIQFADVHLDSVIGGAIGLPAEKKAVLRQDLRSAVTRACALAVENRAELVLIPGDLFDYESLASDTPSFLADAFREIAPARVFIAPGNHDSLRPGSPYVGRSGATWPDNVHVFTRPEFETVTLGELDCTVTGMGHAHRGLTDRLIANPISGERRTVNVLLFHGSRDGYRPSDKETVIPFSDAELLAQGFTYSAIGHYHSHAVIEDELGQPRASYSGCIQGRGLDETGEKCVVVGEIGADGSVALNTIEAAARRVVSVSVSLTGVTSGPQALERIGNAITASGARECDLVQVALGGAVAPSLDLDTSALESSSRHFHLSVSRSRLEPDYDLAALSAESAASPLRSAFVRRMLELQDACAEEDERRALRDAVYYGLYALDGRRLEPRDAD